MDKKQSSNRSNQAQSKGFGSEGKKGQGMTSHIISPTIIFIIYCNKSIILCLSNLCFNIMQMLQINRGLGAVVDAVNQLEVHFLLKMSQIENLLHNVIKLSWINDPNHAARITLDVIWVERRMPG